MLPSVWPGAVVYLDPAALISRGGRATGDPSHWVNRLGYFLIVEVTKQHVRLRPLYSRWRKGRELLPTRDKSGPPTFVDRPSYWSWEQEWISDPVAVRDAASEWASRNGTGASVRLTPQLLDFMGPIHAQAMIGGANTSALFVAGHG